ncbi:MAG: UDP-N-acetylenolpyruvoylglucosamine reductase [Candidatus Woykebacteria bacterium RIFCSPHIGHO2_01_FULL_39_12]|uniref:UDP-N-acetylenolpyruvoylglucosamine reductase n=1 Tax=Candidatus Woykebacteria bacterium RIFCSPHIGHO2_01_FULL_39_12 TaxID=1802599 RepID=A0A1G1WHT0_9BACT|nr:MAG: UDP-N-acetylenolpyruvoylglucosamine reductase [Candidatus Woykebacteria bacterium RIFCSPHIGHO2_01_FULL_39_12]
MKDYTKIIEALGKEKVKENEPMKLHTNMKVGGPADLFIEVKTNEELKKAVLGAIKEKIPYTIIGNGANVLVSDQGVAGLVILNESSQIRFISDEIVEADSGVDLSALIKLTREKDLAGMEREVKVPGTVGGAVYMNAGDTGKKEFFGDLVESVEIIDKEGNAKTLSNEECEFAYRSSRFQKSGEVIVKAKLKLQKTDPKFIEEKTRNILERKINHPAGATVGSTFKNPDYDGAGRLIEACGLKNKKIGGAKISEKHANFIINEGNAKAVDVKALIDLMKKSVKEKFGIDLQEEVRYIGRW